MLTGNSAGDFSDNIAATSAKWSGPERVAGDSTGRIYVVDSGMWSLSGNRFC